MEKEILQTYVNAGLSFAKMAKEENCSISTIRYWLKKHDLKTLNIKENVVPLMERCCPKCETVKPIDEFYSRRNQIGNSSYCKICTNQQVIDRQRKFKQDCVDYKGGCCEVCGYDKCNAALEFHHLDPKQKDFSIANARHTEFGSKTKSELDKCILVCANCHREIHDGLCTPT